MINTIYMKLKALSILLSALVASTMLISACGSKTEDPPPTTTKTLNKSILIGKKWYNQGSTEVHDIRANGVYGSGGTWEWKNNTDTMIFDLDGSASTNAPVEYKFFWSAEHEMACKRAKSGSGEILYKDAAW